MWGAWREQLIRKTSLAKRSLLGWPQSLGFQASADLLSEMLILGFHSQVWVFVNLPFLADPLCEMATFVFFCHRLGFKILIQVTPKPKSVVSSPSVGNNIVPGSLGLLGTPYRTHETFVTPKWIFALVSPLADIRRRLPAHLKRGQEGKTCPTKLVQCIGPFRFDYRNKLCHSLVC